MLFGTLTVAEHLALYADVRGLKGAPCGSNCVGTCCHSSVRTVFCAPKRPLNRLRLQHNEAANPLQRPPYVALWQDQWSLGRLIAAAPLGTNVAGDKTAAVVAMAEAVDLAKKLDSPAAALSGGMKRKLQVRTLTLPSS